MVFTFHVVTLAWIYFRAKNISDANYMISNLFSNLSLSQITQEIPFRFEQLIGCFVVIVCVIIVDILSYKFNDLRNVIRRRPFYMRWPIYISLILMIMIYGQWTSLNFIYFQF